MAIRAPFRFAPISRWVYFPDWAPLVSHDIPFKDGVSGEIGIEIEVMTPLLIGGARRKATEVEPGEVWPFKEPQGRYAIPGETLQGLVRSILSIATFGKLGPRIEKKRFGIRDLSKGAKPFYQDQLTESDGNRPVNVRPRVKTGWLRKTDSGFELKRCKYARIEYNDLVAIAGGSLSNWTRKSDVDVRYNCLNALRTQSPPIFYVDPQPVGYDHRSGTLKIYYRKTRITKNPSKTTVKDGKIVLTGNPADPPKNPSIASKHMEFLFYDEEKPIKLENFEEKFLEFLAIHAPEDGRPINPNWDYYNTRGYPDPTGATRMGGFAAGGWMPIFYLPDAADNIKSFGIAFMFKAAHALSTHDMLRNSTPDHLPPDDPAVPPQEDLPDLIFGSVASATSGLKRRAAFDMAIAKTAQPEKRSLGPTILLAPKPSYYPIYVRQPQGAGGGPDGSKLPGDAPYATYTPLTDRYSDEHRMPELAGVKIWPAIAPSQCRFPNLPPPPDCVGNKVKIYLNAVPAATFATTLRVHNLRTVELGAVLWALTFGEAAALQGQPSLLRHRLGMGKPYGLGVVQIRITKARLTPNDPNLPELSQRDMATMVETFTSHMQRRCKSMNSTANWDKTAQVMALLKAADPQQNTDLITGYMPLEAGRGTYVGERKESQFMPLYVPSVFEFARNARARPATPPAPAARRGQAGAAPNSLVPGCRVEDTDFQFGQGTVLTGPDRDRLVRVRFNHGEEMLHVSELKVLR